MLIDTILSPNTLGFIAGIIMASSYLPDCYGSLRKPDISTKHKVIRDIFACTGNLCWVVYGIFIGSWPIIIFCSVALLSSMTLVLVQFWLRLKLPPIQNNGETL